MRKIAVVMLLVGGCQFFLDSLDEAGNCDDLLDNDNNSLIDCNDPACTADPFCNNSSVCGNRVIENGETCDDGNQFPNDGCDALCQSEPIPPTCGNGNLDVNEECDDANNIDTDGCNNACRVNGQLFVDCQAQAGGDGSAAAPFASLGDAVAASPDGQLRNIILLGGQCDANVNILN